MNTKVFTNFLPEEQKETQKMIKLNQVEEKPNIITYVYHKYYPRTGGNTSPIKCLNGDIKQFKITTSKTDGWIYTEYVNGEKTGRIFKGEFKNISEEFFKMGYYLTNGLGSFYRNHNVGDEELTIDQITYREAYAPI